jgi:DNA (cytosine-5)-methyltransferase 1
MGFPDKFRIPVSDTQAYKQFGNSVVVPLVRAVARRVVEALQPSAESQAPAAVRGRDHKPEKPVLV